MIYFYWHTSVHTHPRKKKLYKFQFSESPVFDLSLGSKQLNRELQYHSRIWIVTRQWFVNWFSTKLFYFTGFESAVLCRWCTVTPSRLYQIGKWREELEGTCLFLKSVKFSAYSLDLKDLSKFHPLVTCFYSFSIYFKTIFLFIFKWFFFISWWKLRAVPNFVLYVLDWGRGVLWYGDGTIFRINKVNKIKLQARNYKSLVQFQGTLGFSN